MKLRVLLFLILDNYCTGIFYYLLYSDLEGAANFFGGNLKFEFLLFYQWCHMLDAPIGNSNTQRLIRLCKRETLKLIY